MALRGVAGLVLALMIGVAGCSGDGSSPEATGPGSELPGDKKPTSTPDEDGGDPPSAMCRLFTAAEIEDLLGTPVDNGSGAGPDGTACQWAGTDDVDAYAQVQVIDDTEYWENPSLGKGYEEVPGIEPRPTSYQSSADGRPARSPMSSRRCRSRGTR